MTITQQPATAPSVEDAWELYCDVFTDIDTLAAQRHLMTYNEFDEVYHDPRVLKFYVHDEVGALIGMSVLTRELEAWPLISPRFFARRWPEAYQRKAIWYVGWVGVRPNHLHGFRTLITRMYPYVRDSGGLAVMDFCTYNVTARRLPEITLKLLGGLDPAAGMDVADTQSFVAYCFDHPGGEA